MSKDEKFYKNWTKQTVSALILQHQEKIFVLNLHYNGSNSFLFVNAVKMYHFKEKDSEMKQYPLCR